MHKKIIVFLLYSQEGDTVGVMRKEMGILHFFVNGVDQGPAAFNIPEHVFGIIGKLV